MKLALVHDHLLQIGGAEHVLKEFSKLYPASPIYTLLAGAESRKYFSDVKIIESELRRWPGAYNHLKWYLWAMPTFWEQFDFSAYDAVLSSTSAFCKGIVTSTHIKHFCYCHTPTRYLWSDTHQYVEDLPQNRIVKKILPFVLTWLRQWDWSAAQRVDYFIANSKFIASRIKKYYGRESVVIYPPVNVSQFGPAKLQKEDYFVIVGRLRPYKRVDLVIKAFNQLGLPLKVIGSGEELVRLQALAKPNVEFLGELPDGQRNDILQRAKAFIHPQEEDFGIAAVEAMAAGTPVIAYAGGGALETVVDGLSGTFFAEQTWESLVDAVLRFDFKKFDPVAIQTYAQKFSLERFLKEMSEYIEHPIR